VFFLFTAIVQFGTAASISVTKRVGWGAAEASVAAAEYRIIAVIKLFLQSLTAAKVAFIAGIAARRSVWAVVTDI